MRTLSLALLAAALLLTAIPRGGQAQNLVADVDDHLVGITTGFAGARILVFGAIEEPGDVVVVVRGPTGPAKLYRKSQVAGIWVNAASLTFVQVPSFYGVATTGPLEEITTAGERSRLKIGVDELDLQSLGRVSENLMREWRDALIRAKAREQLYWVEPGEVLLLNDQLFRVTFELPTTVSTGTYLVDAYLFQDGVAVAAQTLPLVINKIGFEAEVYNFAQQNSALYGLSAIAIALLAGWLAHLIFRRN